MTPGSSGTSTSPSRTNGTTLALSAGNAVLVPEGPPPVVLVDGWQIGQPGHHLDVPERELGPVQFPNTLLAKATAYCNKSRAAAAAEIEIKAGGEAGAAGAGDPAASRVALRASTKKAIQDAAPKTSAGDFIDPNTHQVIPQAGPFDYGHKPAYEWWRTQQMAREQGWTRQQVIDYENIPDHYEIEDPSSNRGHGFEMPR